jgi:hypothetical protein
MPAKSRPREALRCIVSQEQAELERLGQADELELGSGRERFGDVATVESAAKAGEGRALELRCQAA